MFKPIAVNNVLILKKDKSYMKSDPNLISEMNYKSNDMTEIPEPYTGIIDSIGVSDSEYQIGQHVSFDDLGGVYLEFDENEYVVITPEMVVGILEE